MPPRCNAKSAHACCICSSSGIKASCRPNRAHRRRQLAISAASTGGRRLRVALDLAEGMLRCVHAQQRAAACLLAMRSAAAGRRQHRYRFSSLALQRRNPSAGRRPVNAAHHPRRRLHRRGHAGRRQLVAAAPSLAGRRCRAACQPLFNTRRTFRRPSPSAKLKFALKP